MPLIGVRPSTYGPDSIDTFGDFSPKLRGAVSIYGKFLCFSRCLQFQIRVFVSIVFKIVTVLDSDQPGGNR